jgi:DNA mismatch repair protein MutS2
LRKEIIKEAQEKAKAMIEAANKTIENTIREIKTAQADKEKTKLVRLKMQQEKESLLAANEEEERIKRKIEQIKNREKRKEQNNKTKAHHASPSADAQKETKLAKGDFVRLANDAVGEILEIKDKTAVIALGNIRTTANTDTLQKVSANQAKKKIQQPSKNWADFRENLSQKRLLFKPDIDVRGMRAEEALQKVIEFIDEGVMLDSKKLRILHGTGTGALRQAIRQYLNTNPLVASCGDEQVQLGGAGITVITLDI